MSQPHSGKKHTAPKLIPITYGRARKMIEEHQRKEAKKLERQLQSMPLYELQSAVRTAADDLQACFDDFTNEMLATSDLQNPESASVDAICGHAHDCRVCANRLNKLLNEYSRRRDEMSEAQIYMAEQMQRLADAQAIAPK